MFSSSTIFATARPRCSTASSASPAGGRGSRRSTSATAPRCAQLFSEHRFDAVIHFAGLKAVGESVAQPLAYYDNNVSGSVALFECMAEAGVKTIVFSSSATVYGEPASVPIREDFPLSASNPYGRSKLMIEEILRDVAKTDSGWRVALLRYFNPVGAHASGLIGEDPNGIPNNLMPYIAQVAVGKLKELPVYGNDYPTPDGTGVRDYIHVVDLARGHLAALDALRERAGVLTVNLGTGRGYSVLEMVRAFAAASGKPVPYRIVARRPGDIAQCYADPTLARDTARLAGAVWHRCDVRRHLALAALGGGESGCRIRERARGRNACSPCALELMRPHLR